MLLLRPRQQFGLSYDFTGGVLPPGVTLARADASTCATYVNVSGLIATAAANVARWTYDPITHAMQGLLNEPTSSNLNTLSQAITGWGAARAVAADNVIISPDGTQNAGTATEDTSTNSHLVQSPAMNWIANSVYPVLLFSKNISGARWANPMPQNGAGGGLFQPFTGSVGSVSGPFATPAAQQFGNGWWRFSGYYTPAGSTSTSTRVYLSNSGTTTAPTYTGDGASGFAVWGLQVQGAGETLGSYLATYGSAVTRAADVLKLPVPNGIYTIRITRLSGVTTLLGQTVSGGAGYVVPTDTSPLQSVHLRKTS